ncbi:Nif3-like dinuclear metal center hexameric protein [Dactylosporangium sp. CA-139066]|uniref:Nif3-like dinuclear metal center hexameric protein n=1 Tax=Dactylosporangium sp. CA-139066 TaxID=3239930 RepID=UPI003D8C806C
MPRVGELPGVELVCGAPDAPAGTVLVAAEASPAALEEAIAAGAGVLLTHRPPGPAGAPAAPATTPKGRLIHRAIAAGVALCARPHDDPFRPLAAALGLTRLRGPGTDLEPRELIATAVPAGAAGRVADAMAAAGAGAIGEYTRCAWTTPGTGLFTPGDAATPALGRHGRAEAADEIRVEMLLPRGRRAAVLTALLAAHPYEEPALHIADVLVPGPGVVGEPAEPLPLAGFAEEVAERLATAAVRYWGDPDHPIRTVALGTPAADAWLGLDVAAAEAAGWRAVLDVARGPALRPWADATARRLARAGFSARAAEHRGETWRVTRTR